MTRNKDASLLACFGVISVFLLGFVIGPIVNGWALSVLWSWFVAPLFELPILSIFSAIGLALVASMVTSRNAGREYKKPGDALAAVVAQSLITPLITVGLGWVVTQFM
jgi:uncharacterized membrane protein SpoIIM required for sporulation